MKNYITFLLTGIVFLTQPDIGGKRNIGKEISIMKHIKTQKGGDQYISTC